MDLLRNFLDWWLRQLVAMIPLRLVQLGFSAGHAAVLEVGGGEAELFLRQRGRLVSVARTAADPAALALLVGRVANDRGGASEVVLRLSAAAILRKQLSLPAGARWHIEKLLGFELDRETPFGRDEAYWGYAVRHHDLKRGTVDVELIIVPRGEVEPLVAAIGRAGVAVIGIEIPSPTGKALFIPLQEDKRHHRLRAYRSLFAPVIAVVALALVAIVTPFIRLHFARSAADKAIAALTASSEEAGALRKTVDQSTNLAAYLDRERQRDGPALAVLASITRDLPDDTHLTALSLHSGHVTIQGLTKSTSKVVELISKDPMFTAQVFDSPVVQDATSGLESFTLSFALKSAAPS